MDTHSSNWRQPPQEGITKPRASRKLARWAFLLLTGALLVGLLSTVAWAATGPDQTGFPNWLEPRGIALTDMVGDVPEHILKDMVISFGGGIGTVEYLAGSRIRDTVVITANILSRNWASSWAPNGQLTAFGCLGQRPFYDHMGTIVPEAMVKLYDASGTDITHKVTYLHVFHMDTSQPLASSLAYERYPTTSYGQHQTYPLPISPQGLKIPTNSGCRLEIVGEDIYPITGVYTMTVPKYSVVNIVGDQELLFRSYIGVGNVGILEPLMTQMRDRYRDRHDGAQMYPPMGSDYILVKVPTLPADAYTDVSFGRPYRNADRPTAGTYRIARDLNKLGADLIVSAGFPSLTTWRDADQVPGREFLPELHEPAWLKSPEYLIPPGMPFQECFTDGGCPVSVLKEIHQAVYPMRIYYLTVRRISEEGTWVPVKMAGPTWRPSTTNLGRGPGPASLGLTQDPVPLPPSTVLSGILAPELAFHKEISPGTDVALNSEVTVAITIANPSSTLETGIVVTDPLPAKTLFARWVYSPSGASESGNLVSWQGDIAARETVTLTFVVTQAASYSETIINTAHLSTSAGLQQAQASFTTESSPTLTVSKTVEPDDDVGYGSPVTYTVELANQGPSAAYGVEFTDSLPLPTTFDHWVEVSPTGTTVTSNKIRWTGELEAGEAVTFTWVVTQDAGYGERVTNSARYTHLTGGGRASATFTVRPSPFLDLDKEVVPNTDVELNQPVTYTIAAINAGPTDAVGFALTDTLDPSTSFASWLTKPVGASVDGNLVTWSGTLTASDSVTLSFVANQGADYGTTVTNTAIFSHAMGQGSAGAEFRVVQPPVLTLTKEISPGGLVEYHGPVLFQIELANGTERDAAGVLLRDELPADTTFGHWIVQPKGALVISNTITWTGTVTASTAVSLTFTVSQSAPYLSKVTNIVTYSLASSAGQAQASFFVESRFDEKVYLPLIFRQANPFEPNPPPATGCPCGWFDSLGRMMDYWPGDQTDP